MIFPGLERDSILASLARDSCVEYQIIFYATAEMLASIESGAATAKEVFIKSHI